jgi:hypothetical protein
MAKLINGTRVYGSLITDTALIAGVGAGFMNVVAFTTGTAATFTFPGALQVPNAKFKVTIIGSGGSGGGTPVTAGAMGGGGGSGAVIVAYITVVLNVYTFTYTVGASVAGVVAANGVAGQASNIIYNGVTYSAAGGALGTVAAAAGNAGGAGGAFTGVTNGTTVNAWGYTGNPGHAGGVMAATTTITGIGGNTPLGFGQGGTMPTAQAGANGNNGTGYGAGGGGARNGTGAATTRTGGSSAGGLVMIEY